MSGGIVLEGRREEEVIETQVDHVLARIGEACERSGRAFNAVRLLAATKHQPHELVEAFVSCMRARGCLPCIGENYVKEARARCAAISRPSEIHLIGHLQSNKARDAVQCCDVIETVDSRRIAQLIAQQAAKLTKRQRIFIQVNISQDVAKSGVSPGDLIPLIDLIEQECPSLALEGLMTITAEHPDPEGARHDFVAMRRLWDQAQQRVQRMLELSMGMSADYAVAIEEGATVVRVGSAIFGSRPSPSTVR